MSGASAGRGPSRATAPSDRAPAHVTAARANLWWGAATAVAFVAFGHAGLIAGLALWAVHLRWDPSPTDLAMGAGTVLAVAALAWLASGVPQPLDLYRVSQRDIPSLLATIGLVTLAAAGWQGTRHEGPAPARDLDLPVARAATVLRRGFTSPVVRAGDLPEVALLRGVALLTAVWLHTLTDGGPGTGAITERWLHDVGEFVVPAFVFAAGCVAAVDGRTAGWTRRTLGRLVVPYLVVSAIGIVLRLWSGAFPRSGNPAFDLLTAATFESYHLVLALVAMVVITPLLIRLRGRAALVALLTAGIAQVAVVLLQSEAFWRVRNPLLWIAFHLAGMLVRRHREQLARWAALWPIALLGWSVAVTAVLVLPQSGGSRRLVALVATWLLLATVWGAGRTLAGLPRVVWWMSDSAYPIYLYHVLFAAVVVGLSGVPVTSVAAGIGWTVTLIGAMSVVVIGRHVLGRRSPEVLGA